MEASNGVPTNPPSHDERAALTTRIIPRISLSTAANPLTAPNPPYPSSATPSDRVAARFQIIGSVILTGGAGTLALSAARAFLEHGASGICLMDLPATIASSSKAIDTLQSEFPKAKIITLACDVTNPENITSTFSEAWFQLAGTVRTLCCFHGIVSCIPSLDVTPIEFQRVLNVNLTGSFLCAQVFANLWVKSPKSDPPSTPTSSEGHTIPFATGASILFTSSISSKAVNFPQPQLAYNLSKAGVSALTKNLAVEWAAHGIRVNCLCPGYMDTVLNAGENLREIRDIWASRNPMGRMGDIEEITGTVVSLCAPRASRYVTGTEVVVDGGGLCL